MIPYFFKCFVFVAVIHHGTVVAAEHDQGIFGQVQAIQSFHQFTDTPIEFDDRIASETE